MSKNHNYIFIKQKSKEEPLTDSEHKNNARRNTDPARHFFGTYRPVLPEGASSSAEIPLSLPFDPEEVRQLKHCIWKWEQSESEDVLPHCHFVVTFEQPIRLTQARTLLNMPYPQWMEPCRNFDKSVAYVRKTETAVSEVFEFGNKPQAGITGDKEGAFAMAEGGATPGEVARKFPKEYARYHAALDKVCKYNSKPRALDAMPLVKIYWGVTGSGKSWVAHDEYPDAYKQLGGTKWFDGYEGEKEIIFEEFDPLSCKDPVALPRMLEYLDRYAVRVETKGSSTQLQAHTFIFTSNVPPTEWWLGYPQSQVDAFFRRVSEIRYYHTQYSDADEGPRYTLANYNQARSFVRPVDSEASRRKSRKVGGGNGQDVRAVDLAIQTITAHENKEHTDEELDQGDATPRIDVSSDNTSTQSTGSGNKRRITETNSTNNINVRVIEDTYNWDEIARILDN